MGMSIIGTLLTQEAPSPNDGREENILSLLTLLVDMDVGMDSTCGHIVKLLKLAELHFYGDTERDFYIIAIFPYRDQNRILNPCMWVIKGA